MVSVVHRINAAFGVPQKFVSYKPNPYEVIRGSIDWVTTPADANTVYVTQIGRIVTLQIAVKFTDALTNTETKVGTLKGVGLPLYTQRIMAAQNTEMFYPPEYVAYAVIDSNTGDIKMRKLSAAPDSAKAIFFNVTYTCKA